MKGRVWNNLTVKEAWSTKSSIEKGYYTITFGVEDHNNKTKGNRCNIVPPYKIA